MKSCFAMSAFYEGNRLVFGVERAAEASHALRGVRGHYKNTFVINRDWLMH